MSKLAAFSSFLVLVSCATACYVESDPGPSRRSSGVPVDDAPPSAGGAPSTSSSSGGAAAPSPVLVEVDTDQTLNADPGQGVGVFVEYRQGGGWHVWWTCDTQKSRRSCAFTVEASVSSSFFLSRPYASAAAVGDTLRVSTTTASEIHGVTFQTSAGAVLTLTAKVDNVADGSFVFFVQDGKVNGGYTGKLTNPVQFVGKTP
jgi:hypothetical protein